MVDEQFNKLFKLEKLKAQMRHREALIKYWEICLNNDKPEDKPKTIAIIYNHCKIIGELSEAILEL